VLGVPVEVRSVTRPEVTKRRDFTHKRQTTNSGGLASGIGALPRAGATEAAAIECADAVDKVPILLSTSPSEGPYDNVLLSSAVSGFWGCRHNQRIPRSGQLGEDILKRSFATGGTDEPPWSSDRVTAGML